MTVVTDTVSVPGRPVIHAVRGGGKSDPPVLLVHGFSVSSSLWISSGWTGALGDAGRAWIAPDLRGHGQSERLPEPADYCTSVLVDDLVRVLDAAQVSRADLVGYSLGGELVLELAIKYPQRARYLVVGGIGRERPIEARDMMSLYDTVARGEVAALNTPGRHMWAAASRGLGADSLALAAFLAGVGASGPVPGVEDLEHPVLLFAGSEDPVASGVKDLAARLPHAELIRLHGHNHNSTLAVPAARKAAIAWLTEGKPSHA